MSKIVHGEGPRDASIMLIGQRPGIEEQRRGRPFIGKSGIELDRYLRNNAGIDRAACYVTNLVKTFDGEDEITLEEIERDWPLLLEEMNAIQPEFVGFLGLYAARAFLGGIDLDWAHSLYWPPTDTQPYSAMALYHPAAGLHMPANAARCAYDFTEFGRMVRGEPMSTAHLSDDLIGHYSSNSNITVTGTMGCDTEGSVETPWCFSVSGRPGVGTVVKQHYYKLQHIIVHAMLHDMPVLKSLGVSYDSWEDTHLMAALLQTEPHGLKALARRHAGMVMLDYEDVVREARREKALEYLSQVVSWMPLDPPKPVKEKRPRKRKEPEIKVTPDDDGGFVATDADIPW